MSHNLYILNEYYKREFSSSLLLGMAALLRKKFNVYIGTQETYKRLLKRNILKKGIMHTKSVTHGIEKYEFHTNLKKRGFKITCHDQEHGLLDNDFIKLFLKPRLDMKNLNLIDRYYCWGNYDYQHLIKYFKKHKNKFIVTGSTRVDAWKKNRQVKLKKKIKTILVVSNFGIVNNIEGQKVALNKIQKDYISRSKSLKKEYKIYINNQKKLFKKFCSLILFLKKEYPKTRIILRPHLTEKFEFWKKNFKNFEINTKSELSELIYESDIIIQNGCTSSLEGTILNKTVINYIPIKQKHGMGTFVKKFTYNCKTYDQIKKIINKDPKTKKNFIKKLKQRLLLPREPSYKFFINDWLGLSKKLDSKKNNHILIKFFNYLEEFIKAKITKTILLLKGKIFIWKQINHKFPNLKKKEIEIQIDDLKKTLNTNKEFKFKLLGNRLVYLYI